MQYFIVGALLIIIIIGAGWLIGFYNIHTNKKFLLDERRAKLESYQEKSMLLISEIKAETNTYPESGSELVDLEIALIKQAEVYNDQVVLYNEFLKVFPNNIAAMILGVKEASFFKFGYYTGRHTLAKGTFDEDSPLWVWQWDKSELDKDNQHLKG